MKSTFMNRARDSKKDQSYFLLEIPQNALHHFIFPVGEMLKTEVRELAANVCYNYLFPDIHAHANHSLSSSRPTFE